MNACKLFKELEAVILVPPALLSGSPARVWAPADAGCTQAVLQQDSARPSRSSALGSSKDVDPRRGGMAADARLSQVKAWVRDGDRQRDLSLPGAKPVWKGWTL